MEVHASLMTALVHSWLEGWGVLCVLAPLDTPDARGRQRARVASRITHSPQSRRSRTAALGETHRWTGGHERAVTTGAFAHGESEVQQRLTLGGARGTYPTASGLVGSFVRLPIVTSSFFQLQHHSVSASSNPHTARAQLLPATMESIARISGLMETGELSRLSLPIPCLVLTTGPQRES